MRALLFVLGVALAPARAAADAIGTTADCPPGQVLTSRPGCGGHGASSVCRPARCTDDERCGDGNRCVDVARCFETVELHCFSGDGRRPLSERHESVMTQEQERGECDADGACAGAARCERFRECHIAPPEPVSEPGPAAPSVVAAPGPAAAATAPPAAGSCACSAGRTRPSGALFAGLWAIALAAGASLRRPQPQGPARLFASRHGVACAAPLARASRR